jgi:hypothetical protein
MVVLSMGMPTCVFSSKKVMRVDFRHCQVLDLVGSAVAFPKSIEFWKDRRIIAGQHFFYRRNLKDSGKDS